MTPALKAMVEAMFAEAERQTNAVFRDDDGKTLCLSVEGDSLDLEKVARAGLKTIAHQSALDYAFSWKDVDPTSSLKRSEVGLHFRSVVDAILKETPS